MHLEGIAAIVTGGASGLGAATAAELGQGGGGQRRRLANSYMNAEVIRLDGGARLQPK
jgi:NADP-dependent 3-hydroxy acid dehydrogenase YdfG